MSGQRIVVVDDDSALLDLLGIRLRRAGYAVRTEARARTALGVIDEYRPQVVVADMRMDELDGFGVLAALRSRHPTLPVIFLTAHGSIPDAVQATRRGAFAYLTKPFDGEELLACIRDALAVQSGEGAAGAADTSQQSWRRYLVTRSADMEHMLAQAERSARSDASILLLGESGTGKELVARAIHEASPRRERPFVAINCTAVPESLFESELFGHRRGAFTGATASRRGLLEAANGGTVLLDEVGDMPLAVQAKLLRVLESRTVRPLGALDDITLDVRVVSATHRDLGRAVGAGEFREDLLYRLNVITLEVPSLATRRSDIPLLVEHFLAAVLARHPDTARIVEGFSRDALELLMKAPWPGNVRQLRNVVEQCAVLATSPLIPLEQVEQALDRRGRDNGREMLGYQHARDRFERDYLVRTLQMTAGNVAQAARLAERSRSEFYKMLRRHALEPGQFRDDAPWAGGE